MTVQLIKCLFSIRILTSTNSEKKKTTHTAIILIIIPFRNSALVLCWGINAEHLFLPTLKAQTNSPPYWSRFSSGAWKTMEKGPW